jgi:antagonist of KipI
LIFLKSGILTSIQDIGRQGFKDKGVNPSGAMDTLSMRLLNTLLGNEDNEAVLEFHYPTPTINFDEFAIIALGGADFSPALNNKPISNWKIYNVKPGDMLSFGTKKDGERAYLAVKEGFKIKELLGSKSTNLKSGFGGIKVEKGNSIELNLKNGRLYNASQKVTTTPRSVNLKLRPPFQQKQEIRVIAGKDLGCLDIESRKVIFNQCFIISNNADRMGFRLEGDCLNLEKSNEQISSAVAFGTIQLLPDGQLIILMADHQTSGGYPKIANVISVDLPILAQLSVGQHITFREIAVEVAESVYMKQEREIKKFRSAVQFYS